MLIQRQALNKLLFFYFLLAVLCYSTTANSEAQSIQNNAFSSYLLKAQKPIRESVCLMGSGNKTTTYFNDIELENAQTFILLGSPSLYQNMTPADYRYFPCLKEKIRIVAPNKVHWLSGEVREYPII